MRESKLSTFSSIYLLRFLFLSLVVFSSLTSGVFIRRTQQFNQNGVIGEITMVEELRNNGQGEEHLQGLLANNAQLIESELDYAAELANLFLSSIENELIEDHYIEKQSSGYNTIEEIKGAVEGFEKAEHEYFENVQKKGNNQTNKGQDNGEEDKVESEDEEVYKVVIGDILQNDDNGSIAIKKLQPTKSQSNETQAANEEKTETKKSNSIKYNNQFDMKNQNDPTKNQLKIENNKLISNKTTDDSSKRISSSSQNDPKKSGLSDQKNQENNNILSQMQPSTKNITQNISNTDSTPVSLNRTVEKGTMRLKLPEVSLPAEKQQQQLNKQKDMQQTRMIFGIIAILISIITVSVAIYRFKKPQQKQLPIHEGVSLIQSRNEISQEQQQQNLSKIKDN